jgi:hypothetical protein
VQDPTKLTAVEEAAKDARTDTTQEPV